MPIIIADYILEKLNLVFLTNEHKSMKLNLYIFKDYFTKINFTKKGIRHSFKTA